MIVVSATDSNDAVASWSSYGDMVAVAAPGVGIWTTSLAGDYQSVSGTSIASPAVAGVVALMMAANPRLSASQIESLLYSSATDLGAQGRDGYFGFGRVDGEAAVTAARGASVVDSQPPTVAITSPASGSSASGIVSIDISASDNVGVARVDLYANNQLLASDVAAPYQFGLDTTQFATGSLMLSAVAVDSAGNRQTSSGVTLTVSNGVTPDTVAPTVSLSGLVDGANVSGTVQIRVSGSDNQGVASLRLDLLIDGARVATATGGSLSYTWNTRKTSLGSHGISAVATDASSNSASRSVTVTRTK